MFDGISAPKVKVEVAWSTSANGVGSGFVLDSSTLGTGVLGGTEYFTDITDDVLSISIRRGRTREFENVEPGTCDITIDNATGDYDPTNLSGRFVVAGVSQVLPMRQVRVTAEYGGVVETLYRGFVEEFGIEMGGGPTTTLQCVDALSLLAQVDVPAISPSFAGDYTSARFDRILDAAGYTGLRLNGSGLAHMIATTYGDTALNLLNEVARADAGIVFVTRNGELAFETRENQRLRAQVYGNTLNLTDDETVGATPYVRLNVAYGASQVVNSLTGQREGGPDITVTDSSSIASFGRRQNNSLSINELQLATDAEVTDYLNYLLGKFKSPDLRVTSVEISDCLGLKDLWASLLKIDVQHFVGVQRTYASHTFDRQLTVEGLSIDMTRGSWRMTLNTSSVDRNPYSTLGTFKLDVNALGF